MALDYERTRKVIYLVAGILPATAFGVFSLLAIMVPPLLLWTAAAWCGIAGLIRAFNRKPNCEIHGKTALMLLCGFIAMIPVTTALLIASPTEFRWTKDYMYVLAVLGSIGPLLVSAHYLFFQAAVLIGSWISTLVPANHYIVIGFDENDSERV